MQVPNVEDSTNDFPLGPYAPWSVTANHSRTISFTTNEGTWMNIDVSPDGQQILFDLLGDIYTLPIAVCAPAPQSHVCCATMAADSLMMMAVMMIH